MIPSEFGSSVLWRQVWGLAALLAAIVFSWMAYGLYQPQVLTQLGFVQLASSLGIMQGVLGAAIEPIVGAYSDQIMRRLGNRLPMIAIGVTLAGLLFVAAALLIQTNLPLGWRWLVPVMMTLWVMAMIVFRGPAIALLRQFAPVEALPRANAVLILVFSLVGCLGPLLGELLGKIGASLTFVAGAIILMAGAALLYSALPRHTLAPFQLESLSQVDPQRSLLTFLVGLGAGLEVNLLLGLVPAQVQLQFPTISAAIISSGVLLMATIVALPLGELTVRIGSGRAMAIGLSAITGCLGLAVVAVNPLLAIIVTLAAGVSFGLVFISMIPYALALVPPSQAGWSTGLYFGGGGLATAIVPILLRQLPTTTATIGAGICVVTVGCILATRPWQE